MRRLLKYLKPYRGLILLSIVLLFAQAMCDLALPDLMSRIVNYGIQGGGITEAAPAAIRQSEMRRALVFLSAADAQRVLDDYVLVDRESSAYERVRPALPCAGDPARLSSRSAFGKRKRLAGVDLREGAAHYRQPRSRCWLTRPKPRRPPRHRASICPGFRRAQMSSRSSATYRPANAARSLPQLTNSLKSSARAWPRRPQPGWSGRSTARSAWILRGCSRSTSGGSDV